MTPPRPPAEVLPVPLEHQEQRWLFEWTATQLVSHPELRWLVAIPNGGKRPKGEAGKMKAEGVKSGYPDVLLDLARGPYHGFRLEVKRRKFGAVSPDQRAWGKQLMEQGYWYQIAYGWEEARDQLLAYLALPRPVHR